jgi:dihydrodipicolinate synthase/N-acetylneuraminate lyase
MMITGASISCSMRKLMKTIIPGVYSVLPTPFTATGEIDTASLKRVIETGFAVPEILVNVVRFFHAGERQKAAEIFYRNVALIRFEFQEGIGMAMRKEMRRRRGAIIHAGIRPPGSQLDTLTQQALDSLLNWFLQQNQDIEWTVD